MESQLEVGPVKERWGIFSPQNNQGNKHVFSVLTQGAVGTKQCASLNKELWDTLTSMAVTLMLHCSS